MVSFSFAQGNKGKLKVSPQWNVGDVKKVHVDENTRISFDDSVVKNLQNKYDVLVKLTNNSSFYTLSWTCKNDEEMLQFANYADAKDKVENRVIQALKSAENQIVFSEFSLQMDKSTGQVKEWLNGKELLKNAEHHEKKKLKAWFEDDQIPEDDRLDIELTFSKKLNAAYDTWRTSLLEKANFFFESYNQRFTTNQTLTEDVTTADILDLRDTETKFPGKLTCEATEVNDRLILDRKIDYDKEFLTLYLRKMGSSFENLSLNEVMIFEKEQSIFDLKSTWLINYTKRLYFEVKGMKTTSTRTVTFLSI